MARNVVILGAFKVDDEDVVKIRFAVHCGMVVDVSSHVDDILPPCSLLETIYVGRRSGLHTGNMELLRDETGK